MANEGHGAGMGISDTLYDEEGFKGNRLVRLAIVQALVFFHVFRQTHACELYTKLKRLKRRVFASQGAFPTTARL